MLKPLFISVKVAGGATVSRARERSEPEQVRSLRTEVGERPGWDTHRQHWISLLSCQKPFSVNIVLEN